MQLIVVPRISFVEPDVISVDASLPESVRGGLSDMSHNDGLTDEYDTPALTCFSENSERTYAALMYGSKHLHQLSLCGTASSAVEAAVSWIMERR
jgi:hypothetical protein